MASDAQIISASRSDPEKFAALFDRHFDAIYRYVASRLGSRLADDVTAEVFLVAFRRRLTYDVKRDDARPWLYGIATNLLRRHHRAEQRWLRAYARISPEVDDFDTESIINRADASSQREAIAGALAALSPGDRDVLLLFAGAGESYQEIADGLNIPIGTVRSRLNRARRIVRELLGVSRQKQDESSHQDAVQPEVVDGRA